MIRIALGGAALALALSVPALAQQEAPPAEFPAVLAGHAVLPAETFIAAPADAPADLKTSGKYTTGKRVEALGTRDGQVGYERPTGVKLPFKGQPLQGHSGIKVMADGTFWVLTDNGFGSQGNSPDFDALPQPLQDRLGQRRAGAHRRPSSCTIPTRRCRSASSMRAPRSAT